LKKVSEQQPSLKFESISNYRDFFEGKNQYDALVISAEAAFSWTMFYPEFGVVVPKNASSKYPIGFAVAKRHLDLNNYFNSWLDIKQANGKVQKFYDYWILGKGSKASVKRWSVIDEVITSDL